MARLTPYQCSREGFAEIKKSVDKLFDVTRELAYEDCRYIDALPLHLIAIWRGFDKDKGYGSEFFFMCSQARMQLSSDIEIISKYFNREKEEIAKILCPFMFS